jgi:YesN/AraC family two-component response regulator
MRNKWFERRKNKLFLGWLKSYFFILIVPLVITNYAYLQSINVIEKEITKAHTASLQQLRQGVDSKLENVEKVTVGLGWNETNKALMYSKDKKNPKDIVKMIKLMKEMKIYKTTYDFIDDIYVYYKDNDYILGYNGKSNVEEYFKFNYENNSISLNDWLNLIDSTYGKKYITYSRNIFEGKHKKSIMFVRSLPIEVTHYSTADIVVMIDEKRIKDEIIRAKWMEQGTVLIIDQNNNIVASTSSIKLPQDINYNKLKENRKLLHNKINGEEVVITHASSNINEWIYVSILPTKVFLEKGKYVRKIMNISVLLCLIIGAVIAYFFAVRNFNPIKNIAEIFQNKNPSLKNNGGISYAFIEKSIQNIIGEKEKIYKKLNEQNYVIRNNFLSRLIKGQVKNSVFIKEACEANNIEFYSDKFVVMAIYIEDFNDDYLKKYNSDSEETVKTARLTIINVFKEIISQKHRVYIVEVDGILCCLVNCKNCKDSDLKIELLDITNNASELIKKNFGIYVTVGISNMHNDFSGISQAYEETIEILEYKRMIEGVHILHYDDISESNYNRCKYKYIVNEERQFINSIKGENYNNARIILDKIFEDSFSKASLSAQGVKSRMFGIINMMFKAVDECDITYNKDFLEQLQLEERLFVCKTVKKLKEEIYDIIASIEKYLNKKKGIDEECLKSRVINYIEKNHDNQNLSVSFIAEIFEVNETYLSRYFKKKTDMGLLEYIHKVRIEKAKLYMKEQKFSVKQIAEKVGFYNSVAFIRVFKKYEGITPGKYMKLLKKE